MRMSPVKRLEHGIKWFAFLLLQVFLKKGRKDFKSVLPEDIKSVVFLRQDKLGDMVISLPVFYNLPSSRCRQSILTSVVLYVYRDPYTVLIVPILL